MPPAAQAKSLKSGQFESHIGCDSKEEIGKIVRSAPLHGARTDRVDRVGPVTDAFEREIVFSEVSRHFQFNSLAEVTQTSAAVNAALDLGVLREELIEIAEIGNLDAFLCTFASSSIAIGA
jgi:hypothetical protein